ncbi:MAG: hypothetical protein M3365_00235 [Gemmatimonadota bacterium]|nr:hypothetical protein [Gemmatimonadota bacterium]
MPHVPFESLPDSARVWVFGSDKPVGADGAAQLLAATDEFLARWAAHGAPLHASRDWRESRFLTIAVDQRQAGASGCSIDGLFRTLQGLESTIGASMLGGGRVYYRDKSGAVQSVARDEVEVLATQGAIGRETTVFDTTVTTLGDWRQRFETTAAESWHAQLLPEAVR